MASKHASERSSLFKLDLKFTEACLIYLGRSHGKSSSQLLRVQIPENTADLRGMRLDQAMQELESKLHECPDDSVLFVVHGHGTGQIKAAVQRHLKGHRMVKKFEYERDSASGCTVVEMKD